MVSFSGCAGFQSAKPIPVDPLEEARKEIHLKSPDNLTAGVAKVDITPAVGTPLAGYSKRRGKPSVGIRDPLYLRVLALGDGEDLVVFVSADLLVFPYPYAEELIHRLSEELKIPRQAIVLTTTHTHSGAGGIAHGFLHEMVFGPYRATVAEGIAGRLLWAAHQAVEHRQPVRWGAMTAHGILQGLTENRMTPSGEVDPDLSVFVVESAETKPLALMVQAAAHPTLMDSQDMRFSADYPGELTQVMEKAYPGAVCLFINGAAGDLRPQGAMGGNPDERIGHFGQTLAEVAMGLMSQIQTTATGDLAVWGYRVSLPPPQIHLGRIPIHPEIGKRMRPVSCFLSLVALKETVFVPLSAEMTTALGLDLKQGLEAEGLHPILMGYANGYLGYAVTPQQYQNHSYESWMTWYGSTFGVTLIEQIRRLADLYVHEKK